MVELFKYSEKEDRLRMKIYKLLEEHVISECGEFDADYALHNTDVTDLVQDLICNCRHQIEFSKQVKAYVF